MLLNEKQNTQLFNELSKLWMVLFFSKNITDDKKQKLKLYIEMLELNYILDNTTQKMLDEVKKLLNENENE